MGNLRQKLQKDNERIKEVDNRIIENIEKVLLKMSQQAKDAEEKVQIVDRMVNLNVLFSNFNEQIAILRSVQNERGEGKAKEEERYEC